MIAMWPIGAASKKVHNEYFKLVFMKSFQFDALRTLENAALCSMKLDLFVIVYISVSVPLFNKSKAHFIELKIP